MTIPSGRNVISGPTTPRKMRIGSMPMIAFQSGMTNCAIDLEDRVPHLVEGVDDRHVGMLPDDGRPRRGLPRFVVAPRPGFQRGGSDGAGRRSSCGASARPAARLPTDGADSFGRSSRPRSHADPAVRAPFARSDARSAWSSLTTSRAPVRGRSRDGPRLVHERQQHLVGGAPAGVADDQPRRDALAAHARVGRAVEHELDADGRRDDRPQPPDQGGLRRGAGLARQGVEEIRPVDQQPVGAGQRVARKRRHHAILRAARPAATIGRVSLLLLVDLDGVVYRGADPVPGRGRGARRPSRARRRRRVRDQQLDALPRRLRDPAGRDGRADHGRPGRLVRAGHGAPSRDHEAGIRRVLVVGGGRPGARAARRRARGGDRRRMPRRGCTRRASMAGRPPARRTRS